MADSMEKEKEEQARKAHALAEKCFLAGNVLGARQWMQSAVRLAPDLPGTPQIVAAYDVHAAAARSRRNWYGVLGLKEGRSVTHDDIKKQYRRLCLLVHPDKNPSAAADGAFKLIHAAWEALLDKHPPLGTAVTAPPPQQQRQAAPPSPPKPQQRPRPPEPKPKAKPPKPQQRPKPQEPKPKPPEPKPKPPKPQQRAKPPEPKPKPPEPQQRPTPPEPEPKPKPRRPRPRPQRTPEPPTSPEPAEPYSKQGNECSNCGAQSNNGGNNYRCMSCHWSPMDGRRHQPHDYDDDRHDDPNEDDYYYEFFGYY